MNPKAQDLNELLALDFDDVVERARALSGRNRNAGLQWALVALEAEPDPTKGAKLLLFIQTVLALTPDGKLTPTLIEPIADKLTTVLLTESEPEVLKRSALDSIALLLLKAGDVSSDTDAQLREAIGVVANSADPELSSFARRILYRRVSTRRRKRSELRPKILLIHGQDEVNVLRLERVIRDHWQATAIILKHHPEAGRTFVEKFEQEAIGARCAMALWSSDDWPDSAASNRAARSNIAFELGLAFGLLGRSRVWMLVKEGAALPSDLEGISRIEFAENVLEVSGRLLAELESANLLPEMQATA